MNLAYLRELAASPSRGGHWDRIYDKSGNLELDEGQALALRLRKDVEELLIELCRIGVSPVDMKLLTCDLSDAVSSAYKTAVRRVEAAEFVPPTNPGNL